MDCNNSMKRKGACIDAYSDSTAIVLVYRKLPLISPGLIELRKGFLMGLKNRFETS